jgi:putative hydrolase of HD superfamily
MTPTPAEIVQTQLDAYNAHDIDAFMATFSPTIQTMRFPTNEVLDKSAEEVRTGFAQYFQEARPHSEVSQRMTQGRFVIDYEMGHDDKRGNWTAIAIYEVVDGVIQNLWFLPH